jgi:DNA-binding LacI/PurR family transcriptional regulator
MKTKNNSASNRITSHDVAELAGVSQSTVSRVLNPNKDNGFISQKTAERVRAAADELNYSPHPIARALRGEKTNLIGLVVREIADPFFAGLIEAISTEARKMGLNVILGHVHSDPTEGLQLTRVMDSRQSDGVVFLGDLRDDQAVFQTIVLERHPVVALCRGKRSRNLPNVNCDNKAGIELLINHLLENGHKMIAFVDGGWFGDIKERREVFLAYKQDHGIENNFSWIQAEGNNFDGGYRAMNRLLDLSQRPTAVMAADDAMAIGIVKAIHDRGFRIPEDLSVTGFDDIPVARFTIPSLTTIRQPIEKMAKRAIEILVQQINNPDDRGMDLFEVMAPELIVRDSTGRASNIL